MRGIEATAAGLANFMVRVDGAFCRPSALAAIDCHGGTPHRTEVFLQQSISSIFNDGGDIGERMRHFDWARTPLGAPRTWPSSLKALVGIMLAANQPMFVAWGPERTLLYNDDYRAVLGHKHPMALGAPFLTVWDEARQDLEPLVDRVFAGEPVHMDRHHPAA